MELNSIERRHWQIVNSPVNDADFSSLGSFGIVTLSILFHSRRLITLFLIPEAPVFFSLLPSRAVV